MNKKLKGLLSLWLALIMVLSSFAAVYAADLSFYLCTRDSIEFGDIIESGSDFIRKDITADSALSSQEIETDSSATLIGWNIWKTDIYGDIYVSDFIKALNSDDEISEGEYASYVNYAADSACHPVLEPIYAPQGGLSVYLYKDIEALSDGDYIDKANDAKEISGFELNKAIDEQIGSDANAITDTDSYLLDGWNIWGMNDSGHISTPTPNVYVDGVITYVDYANYLFNGCNLLFEPIFAALHTVYFESNSAGGEMTAQKVKDGTVYTLPECGFTAPDGKAFKEWEISATSGGTFIGNKAANETIPVNEEITLKAIWQDKTAAPVFTPNGGSFTSSSLNVEITCATSAATIYYTTDGTIPTDESTVYTEPISITSDTTVKAVAKADGIADSDVTSAFFDKRSSGGGGGSSSYKVTFNTDGGTEIKAQYVKRNKTAEKPEDPTKDGYTFGGWYSDKELTESYNFETAVTKAITIYAKWTSDTDNAGSDGSGTADNRIILTIGDTTLIVFGKSQEMDVAPQIVNNRAMLPARFIAEAMGAKVTWTEEEPNKVLIEKDDIEIIIYIGSETAYVNGEAKTLDSTAFLENDRTFTPYRFIAETLGASVEWIAEKQQVVISVPQ